MRIYADNAATTKLSKEALRAMMPYMTDIYANPSSVHSFGSEAKRALVKSRESIAGLIGCSPGELYFTSGGSEGDNQALFTSAAIGKKSGKNHIISVAFEHPAILKTLEYLKGNGYDVTLLNPDISGKVYADQIKDVINENTCLVSVMSANNETGVLQPVEEIGKICRDNDVIFHTDAVQTVGHIPVNVEILNADILTFSAHKFHGPKGAGAIYIKRGLAPYSVIRGGGQERGTRAGTENVAAIVGMETALSQANEKINENSKYVTNLREMLIDGLEAIHGSHLIGDRHKRIPGTVNFCFDGIESEMLVYVLDQYGICASSASACSAGALEVSHVLLSMGIDRKLASGALRLSLCEYNNQSEVEDIIKTVDKAVTKLRR